MLKMKKKKEEERIFNMETLLLKKRNAIFTKFSPQTLVHNGDTFPKIIDPICGFFLIKKQKGLIFLFFISYFYQEYRISSPSENHETTI